MSVSILTYSKPETVGMDPIKLKNALSLVDHEVGHNNIPGGTILIARKGKIVAEHAAGWAEITEAIKRPMELSTIFDLASLTKVMATLPAVLMLMEQGYIRLKDPVSYYLPEFASNGKEGVTVKHLLTHISGLPAHRALYNQGWDKEQILQYIWNQSLEYPAGSKMVYSDLGFITLGAIVEKVTGIALKQWAKRELYEPLGMTDTSFLPSQDVRTRIAATEYDSGLGRHRVGEVHDENSSALGGVSGHAGLFATVMDVAVYGQLWLNGGVYGNRRIFSPITVRTATECHTAGIEEARRGLGWVLKDDMWDASGDLLSSAVYGHTGFTGTSITCDPQHQLLVVLLTNRVHFGREKNVVRLRSILHNAVAASIEE